MKKTLLKKSSVLIIFLFFSATFSSCEKEKDTIGIIKVVYSNGNLVNGATVLLSQNNTIPGTSPIPNLTQSHSTDASGKAEFTYRYEAILDVNVTKNSGNDTYTGSGVIRLLRGKTEQITVEIIK
tara:strand:+ start:270 stop:644 length:375 start_codon:yes stop_codon:yes gene_type:complete